MVLPISILAVHQPILRPAPARAVEPVCESTCNCEGFPPTNAFALPPPPFAKFLEHQNIIDRFQRDVPQAMWHTYTAQASQRPCRHEEQDLGRMIDRLA
jgi:hypothetical protein